MRFYGSAMRFPHVQGAFRETIVCLEAQAHVVADGVSLGRGGDGRAARGGAACDAPRRLADGQARAGQRQRADRRAVRDRGAARRRRRGRRHRHRRRRAGVCRPRSASTAPINVAREPEALDGCKADKGYFDALFEASGAEAALRGGLDVVRPGGVIVQLGLGGEMTIPINSITAKELELRGTFRFHEEFALALEFMGKGLIDVKPLISATVPFTDATRRFRTGDRPLALDESATRVLSRVRPSRGRRRGTGSRPSCGLARLALACARRARRAPSRRRERPIAAQSTAIVVSRGWQQRATSKSPKPAMAMRPGTSMPRRWHSASTPKAERSETHMIASTSGQRLNIASNASAPCAIVTGGLPARTMRSLGRRNERAVACLNPARRSAPRVSKLVLPPMNPIRRRPRS